MTWVLSLQQVECRRFQSRICPRILGLYIQDIFKFLQMCMSMCVCAYDTPKFRETPKWKWRNMLQISSNQGTRSKLTKCFEQWSCRYIGESIGTLMYWQKYIIYFYTNMQYIDDSHDLGPFCKIPSAQHMQEEYHSYLCQGTRKQHDKQDCLMSHNSDFGGSNLSEFCFKENPWPSNPSNSLLNNQWWNWPLSQGTSPQGDLGLSIAFHCFGLCQAL